MSSLTNGDRAAPSTPQSSKKRKIVAQTPETSKKKRKHDKRENGIPPSQESVTSNKDNKKKKKKELKEVVEESPILQATEDIDLPDATVELDTSSPQIEAEGLPITDGIDDDEMEDSIESIDATLLQSKEPSCFYEKRLSLQLPIPAISLASPTKSLLSLHLAPLLLTYFPPVEGIILSFSEPVLSAKPQGGVNLPLQSPKTSEIPRYPPKETFTRCADGYGVCWVWLTVTFLVFKPKSGDKLKGWTNVTSEGFVGLVSYNYFQTAVGKTRIPKSWIWDGPTRESAKSRKTKIGKLRDESSVNGSQEIVVDSQETAIENDFNEGGSGSFMNAEGDKVPSTQTFRVVDVEMVPGHEKDKWTLQIDGSLLSSTEESTVVAEERQRFENVQNRSRSRSKTPGFEPGGLPIMSGALPFDQIESPS